MRLIETDFHRDLKKIFVNSEYHGAPHDVHSKLMDDHVVRNCILPSDVGLNNWYSWHNHDSIRVSDGIGVFLYGINSMRNEDLYVRVYGEYEKVFFSGNDIISSLAVPLYLRSNDMCSVEDIYDDSRYRTFVFALVGFVVEKKRVVNGNYKL